MPRLRGLGFVLALVARFFRSRAIDDVEVPVFGRTMRLNPRDRIGNMLLFTPQWYDPRERVLLAQLLRPGDYVLDVGANIGAYSLIFGAMVGPRGRVTAIEAEADNASRLRHNISLNGMSWVVPIEGGVSDKEEYLPLHLDTAGNGGAHSLLLQLSPDGPTQTIRCNPLYAMVEKRKPRLLKLDIEGFEWRVLRAFFQDAPKEHWPDYIFLEDEPRHRENNSVEIAHQHGYQVMAQFDNNYFLEQRQR